MTIQKTISRLRASLYLCLFIFSFFTGALANTGKSKTTDTEKAEPKKDFMKWIQAIDAQHARNIPEYAKQGNYIYAYQTGRSFAQKSFPFRQESFFQGVSLFYTFYTPSSSSPSLAKTKEKYHQIIYEYLNLYWQDPSQTISESFIRRYNEAVGFEIADIFLHKNYWLDIRSFQEGLDDGLQNRNSKIDIQEEEKILRLFQNYLQMDLKKRNEEFFQSLKKNKSILKHPSGFLYEIIKESKYKDRFAKDGQPVMVKYQGRLIDNTIFDDNLKEPVSFLPSNTIPGMSYALTKLPLGGVYRIYIPEYLGYGQQGMGNLIPPYSTLIFQLELLDNPETPLPKE